MQSSTLSRSQEALVCNVNLGWILHTMTMARFLSTWTTRWCEWRHFLCCASVVVNNTSASSPSWHHLLPQLVLLWTDWDAPPHYSVLSSRATSNNGHLRLQWIISSIKLVLCASSRGLPPGRSSCILQIPLLMKFLSSCFLMLPVLLTLVSYATFLRAYQWFRWPRPFSCLIMVFTKVMTASQVAWLGWDTGVRRGHWWKQDYCRCLETVLGKEVPVIVAVDSEYLFNTLWTQRNAADKTIRAEVNIIRYELATGKM